MGNSSADEKAFNEVLDDPRYWEIWNAIVSRTRQVIDHVTADLISGALTGQTSGPIH
jgi:hypothetical protein